MHYIFTSISHVTDRLSHLTAEATGDGGFKNPARQGFVPLLADPRLKIPL